MGLQDTATDVYEEMYQASSMELEAINNSDVAGKSLEFSLSNSSKPTDYEAWSKGSARFADDNYDVLKRWVQ